MPTSEVAEATVLDELAAHSKTGLRCMILVGKVLEKRTYAAKDGQPASIVCKCVSGEGRSEVLRFPDSATTPGVNYEGAFLVEFAYAGQKGIVYDCHGFK